MYRYIDKCMGGRRDICINGWMDGWMYRYIDKCMGGRRDIYINGWVDGWMDI